jgi:pyruvate dehydrogenase E1 component alpha subunit
VTKEPGTGLLIAGTLEMPRSEIEFPCEIEHLAILDEKGEIDDDLEPDLSRELLLEMHRAMLLARRFDERLLELQRAGEIGTFAPVHGQEAAQIGAVAALQKKDWVVPSFRETAASLWRGTSPAGILLYDAGYNEGGRVPDEINDLPIAIPVATQLPHAVGIGYAIRLGGGDDVVMTFFGDGATSEGDFHEGLNFAAVLETPVVFLCQNNQWAISTPREKQTASKSLAQKAVAYGMPGIQVDGNDVLAVHVAASEAVERARRGDGPTLIECVTYRMSVHTTADDPRKYRSEKEEKRWKKRDPITRLQKYLRRRDVLSKKAIEELEEEIGEEIAQAWAEAREQIEQTAGPGVMFDHLYAETPSHLEEQRRMFEERAEPTEHGRDDERDERETAAPREADGEASDDSSDGADRSPREAAAATKEKAASDSRDSGRGETQEAADG